MKVLQGSDWVFSFLLLCFTIVKVQCCDQLTLRPASFAKWIHPLSFCCYSNHYQATAVAKPFFKNFQKWLLVRYCSLQQRLQISLASLRLPTSTVGDITARFQVAPLTNTRRRVGQTFLYYSEEVTKLHFLWKWERLVLPGACEQEPLSPVILHPHPCTASTASAQ